MHIALTSRLTRKQLVDDLGVRMLTLNKWIKARRGTEVVQIPLRIDRIGTGNSSIVCQLPGLHLLTLRYHRAGISGGYRLVTFTGVVHLIYSDAADVLIRPDLGQEIGQHWGITNGAVRDLDGPNPQRLLTDAYAYFCARCGV